MAIKLQGYVFKNDGTALSGATVQVYDTSDSSTEGTAVTTDSNGLWTYADLDTDALHDVKISSGGSVRWRMGEDKIQIKEAYIRNSTSATQSPLYLANATNATSVKVLDLSNKNSTRADNDEIYISFNLNDDGGTSDEFARITAIATDVTAGEEDGALVFSVADNDNSGNLQEAFRISSSTGGTVSQTFTTDSFTIGTGGDTDVVLNFSANTASGVITWMEDEDYFKFSDEILMNSTEKILFGDTATFIHQSSDGVMTVDGEATIDLNASTAVLVSNDLKLNSDSAVLGFGADNDTTLTHTDGTGLTLNSTNKLTFGDTGTFIHQSSDGVLTITSDTTVDINGAVAFDGAITGATNITLSGELDAATLDLSSSADIAGDLVLSGGADGALQFTNAGENSIKIPDNQSSALIIEEADNAYITFNTTNSSEAITVAKATTFSVASTLATGTTIGNLTLANGSITDSGGALDFGNETLTTTGTADLGATTVDSLSVSDANITNVADIALDSISADGTDINIATTDNSATAFTIKQGSDAYLIVDTANSSESVSIGTGISGTAITIGHSTSETTVADNLTVTGDFTVNGTTTTIDTTNLTVTDSLIKLTQGTTASPSNDQGIVFTRGNGSSTNIANRAILWDESADVFAFANTNDEAGTTTGNVDIDDYASIRVGALTADDAVTLSTIAEVGSDTDKFLISDSGVVKYVTGANLLSYIGGGTGGMTSFQLEDDDGTEVTISNAKEVKIIGSGVTTNWTDTDNGTDADPYDLTITVDAAQTGINSLLATDIVIGEDAQTKIDFETANEIHFDADNAERVKIDSTGLNIVSGSLETATIDYTDGDLAITIADGGGITAAAGITSTAAANSFGASTFAGNITLGETSTVSIGTPLLPTTDHTSTGITAEMLAGGAISAFDLVCIHTTTQEVVEADASAIATARVIGIAPAAISDTATGTILLQGFIRDDTWTWTTGSPLYLSETAGAMTHTAPTTDGAFVVVVGIALSPDVVYINPSVDIIEHA